MFKPLFFSTHCHRKHSHKDIFTFFCFLSEDICKIGAAMAGWGEHNCKESHNSIRWEYPNVEMLQWENTKVSKQSNIHMFKHQSDWYSNMIFQYSSIKRLKYSNAVGKFVATLTIGKKVQVETGASWVRMRLTTTTTTTIILLLLLLVTMSESRWKQQQ